VAESPNVRLTLSNKPENVSLVREMLRGVAEAIELEGPDLDDIRTAVTEACNNVVLHAYGGEVGLLQIDVHAPRSSALEVVVRDRGIGIGPQIRAAGSTPAGIGLVMIQALVRRVELSDAAGRGSEVRMEFATPSTRGLEAPAEDSLEPAAIGRADLTTTVQATIAPVHLAEAVLPRILGMLAARANFSTDRISDVHLIADALVAHAPASIGDSHISAAISIEPRSLELRIGPLATGRAERLMVDSTLDGLGPVIESLTDHHGVASVGSSEVLALQLTDRR
jgi:anti-sigma regulatory factor (Ser/Thr protein kinase)